MKDIHELLQEKEMDRARVQKEIDALRLVIPLLEVEALPEPDARKQPEHEVESPSAAQGTGTEGPIFSSLQTESSFWKRRR